MENKVYVKVAASMANPGKYCLYSMSQGIYFGKIWNTLDEANAAAERENARHSEFERIRLNHIAKKGKKA